MKQTKIILIDCATRTVTEKRIDDDLQSFYKELNCECITSFGLENDDAVYCDDEGLFNEVSGAFKLNGWTYPIVTKAIIIGSDLDTGENADCITTKEEIENQIIWYSKEEAEAYAKQFN